jgi:hypothetical protein
MKDKVFLGRIKVINTRYGEMVKVSFGPKDLEILNEHKNDQGWSNWVLKESQSGSKYMELDDWKAARETWQESQNSMADDEDDLLV